MFLRRGWKGRPTEHAGRQMGRLASDTDECSREPSEQLPGGVRESL